jgi:hypothetical protein
VWHHGAQQALQRGERQGELGLDALRLQDQHAVRTCRDVRQQGGLADAWVTAQDERTTTRSVRIGDELGEARALSRASVEHGDRRYSRSPILVVVRGRCTWRERRVRLSPSSQENDMCTISPETVPQTWDDERDNAFFRIVSGLFSSEFTYGAGVLLASNDLVTAVPV